MRKREIRSKRKKFLEIKREGERKKKKKDVINLKIMNEGEEGNFYFFFK